MAEKYSIKASPIPPRMPRIGKHGVVDWREDCARCHNCVKKACIYDRYRAESEYIRGMEDVDALYFDCMGCMSCVQECTKRILSISINPMYQTLGNRYWTPDIVHTTYLMAENGKVPVSGSGYRGKFTGDGFDAMWTDMSEIVRPTRDGIHGREYISTSADIGRKDSFLSFDGDKLATEGSPLIELPLPLVVDMMPADYSLASLGPVIKETMLRTGLIAIIDSKHWADDDKEQEKYLPHIALHIAADAAMPNADTLKKMRFVEIQDAPNISQRISELKRINPDIVISTRVALDASGTERAIELASDPQIETIHLVADMNGDEIGTESPRHLKDMIRQVHTALIENGKRDEVTLMVGGGIALPEHLAKAVICGADLVSTYLPMLIALECRLCDVCDPAMPCPAKLECIDLDYGVGRMTNLLASWHSQLIEVMGAMGIREARRLRGDVGRCMFFEEIEEETFGKLFGKRKKA